MATLVLSTVGTILGGPIGGAIGSLVGQSIDQQILASPRRGPRLGDLAVQTSSYGTQIPRIYGTMRVAGSVVWATDLIESSATSGAKGQPDVTYSYSVSFAVALSSRPASAIKRIWADGKLLRGEAGDFKVSTEFRYYDGTADQAVDPLIASIEGPANTPAYRGLALAVFENLELADYGNRIPFLTFEVAADESAANLATILSDASGARISCATATTVIGYAAFGRSIAAAVAPLIDGFGIDLADDGEALRSPPVVDVIAVGEDDLGASADARVSARWERQQSPAHDIPTEVTLSYYDPERDYQTGSTRASVAQQIGSQLQMELPAVVDASQARLLVEEIIARKWAERDKLILRLPPKFLALEPGATVSVPDSPTGWQAVKCNIDAMCCVAELRPAVRISAMLEGEAGRSTSDADLVAGPVTLAVIELPDLGRSLASSPSLHVAASSPGPVWRPAMVEISAGSFAASIPMARTKAVLGQAIDVLGPGGPYLIDVENSVEVQLVDDEQWLTSCDDNALINGANLALLGGELVQFGVVDPTAPGRFRLSRFLRGRFGSDYARGEHSVGDTFLLIDSQTMCSVAVPDWARGSLVRASCTGAPSSATSLVSGQSVRPPSPVQLRAMLAADGSLALSWIRRDRRGWSWVDDVDAPLSEGVERYIVAIEGPAGIIERDCVSAALVVSESDLGAIGTGAATVRVRQIGDWAASPPAEISITIP
jgi:hypothetical protein